MQVKKIFLIVLLVSLKLYAPFADYFNFSLTKKSQPDSAEHKLTQENVQVFNKQNQPPKESSTNWFSAKNSKKSNIEQTQVPDKVNNNSFSWFSFQPKSKSNSSLENKTILSDAETLSTSSSSKNTIDFDLPTIRQIDTNQFLSMVKEKDVILPSKIGDDAYNRVLYGTGGGKYSYNTLAKSVPDEVKQLVQDLTGNQLPDAKSIDGKAMFNGGYWKNGDNGGITVQVKSVSMQGELPVVSEIQIFGPKARVVTITIDPKTKNYQIK
ncbi:MAG: hypothetical protein ACXWL2_00645 [Candidatus Chromulinivorax sp.]